MKITIVSAFRNAVSYIPRYCEQVDELRVLLEEYGHSLHLVLGYGDSHDGTGEELFEQCSHRFSSLLLDVSHGGPHYGSVVHPTRFKQLAGVGNALWRAIDSDSDIVGLVESDLIWKALSLRELISQVGNNRVMAPMILHRDGRFYDTWAFRRKGINFKNTKPYHPDLRPGVRHYLMNSVGSVLFMRYSLANKLHWPAEDVVVGVCRQAREEGAIVVLDSYLQVYHP